MLWASVCVAQTLEVGGTIGYGAYRNASVNAPAGTATAGFTNRFAVGALYGEDLYEHVSGEIRYLYQDGDPFVSAGSQRANVQGQSHAIHYDFLFHVRKRGEKIRPYFIAGGGIKVFRITGPAPLTQPLPQMVTLTTRNEAVGLFTAGVGVKYRLSRYLVLRGDFIDYVTPFPGDIFVPAAGGTGRGIFHQFTPTFGISLTL